MLVDYVEIGCFITLGVQFKSSLGIQSLIHNSVYSIPTTFNEPDPAGHRYYYLGNEAFNSSLFKHYMVRKVDRDKCVRLEASDVHVYSDNTLHPIKKYLTSFSFNGDKCCPLCRKGPFTTANDWKNIKTPVFINNSNNIMMCGQDIATLQCKVSKISVQKRPILRVASKRLFKLTLTPFISNC